MDDQISTQLNNLLKVSRIGDLYATLAEAYKASALFAHGWDHIHRTLVNALMISSRLNDEAEMEIVVPAVLLHDIGFFIDPDPFFHHINGAEHCLSYLNAWSGEEKTLIAECIRKHKGLTAGFNTKPETLEERIVCDADLLEKSGYIGLMQGLRTFVEFGEGSQPKYRSLHAIALHLMQAHEIEFFTTAGREIAKERGGIALRADIFSIAAKELEPYY